MGFTRGAAAQLSAPEGLGPGVLLGPKRSPKFGLTFLKPPFSWKLRFAPTPHQPSSLPEGWVLHREPGSAPSCSLSAEAEASLGAHALEHQHEPLSPTPWSQQNHLRPLRRPNPLPPHSYHGLSHSGVWTQHEGDRVGTESPDVRSSPNCVRGESHYLSEPQFPCGGVHTYLRGLLWKTVIANADLGAAPVHLALCQTLYMQHLNESS